ncbi:hypothetical protein J2X36_002149 [Methylobacterium sp. BE186]|uniref:hypothetical protein n=1 Tax=Methylobacterium sp. BE186 TaxID=2817715 RepID=UPI00285A1362|nr:hypothetical protein [Methylobacterium sp. BE186]MDR7037402.1 hypothetical protein [Methylobacterium sp. BE186]
MGIFDALTGAAASNAARKNQAVLAATSGQANNAINGGYTNAVNALTDANGPGALTALGQGYDRARSDLGSQYGQTQGFLGQLQGLYAPMVQGGGNAYNAYLDATGANGAEGSARATSAFRAGPGYEFQQQQGLDTIQRLAASRGNLAGGNTTADLLKFSQGLADQSFQQYTSNLGNAANSYATGIAGQAAGITGQGAASQAYGNGLSGLGTGLGIGLGNIYGQAANLLGQQGQSLANVQTGLGKSLMENNNTLAASQSQASSNLLDTLGGAFTGFSKAGGISGFAKLFA